MKGLINKDLIQIKNSIQPSQFFFLLLGILPAIANPNYTMIISVLISSMFIASQLIVTLSYDENFNWNKTTLSLPISISKIVLCKYIISLILTIFGVLIITLIGTIYSFAYHDSLKKLFEYGLQSIAYMSFFSLFCIPISFRFGVSSTKYFMMSFIGVPVLIGYIINLLNIDLNTYLIFIFSISKFYLMLICLMILIFLWVLSFYLSKRWYRKKI